MINPQEDGTAGAQTLRDAGADVAPDARAWLGVEVNVGSEVRLGAGAVIVADALRLGDGVVIGANADLRAGRLEIGARSEVGERVRALVADDLVLDVAARLESEVSIVCRSFTAGRLFYFGHHSSVGYGGTTASTSFVRIGHRVALGPHSLLNANLPIDLEDEVGSGAYLAIWTHGYHFGHRAVDGYEPVFHSVHVERNVWLGYHVTVLPGVRIGQNSILAAGAVAARDLPADVLAAGVPAVVKRPLAAERRSDASMLAHASMLIRAWAEELVWKGVEVSNSDDGTLVGGTHLVTVLPTGACLPPPLPGVRQVLVSLDEMPETVDKGQLAFALRPGSLHGELDDIGQDLRDFLRRHAMPCGDDSCFQSLDPLPFHRLRTVGGG